MKDSLKKRIKRLEKSSKGEGIPSGHLTRYIVIGPSMSEAEVDEQVKELERRCLDRFGTKAGLNIIRVKTNIPEPNPPSEELRKNET